MKELDELNTEIGIEFEKYFNKLLIKLRSFSLLELLANNNPYYFSLNKRYSIEFFIRESIERSLYSQQESAFSDLMKNIAVFINKKVFGGIKSGINGIDLEFENNNTRYIVSIKSGPNWANSNQTKKLISDFKSAKKTLRTSNSQMNVVAVNGCCYGIDNKPDKGEYFKYCGQKFWEFISGEANLYIDIIEPLGHKAREKNEEFMHSYPLIINKFTKEFSSQYCDDSGEILWQKIVEFNSSQTKNK